MRKRLKLSPLFSHLFMEDDLQDFMVEMFSKLGIFLAEPSIERVGQVKEFRFIEEGLFHQRLDCEAANIDLDSAAIQDPAVGRDVGVFVEVSFFTAGDNEVDDAGDRFFCSFDVTCGHLIVDPIMDEVCAALENEVGLVEVDHMLHVEFVNEGDALLQVVGFVEMDVDESGLFRELLKPELIAAVLNADFFCPFSVFEVAVPFDEWDIIEVGRFFEMPLFEKLDGIFAVFTEEDIGLSAASEVSVWLV